MKPLVGSAEGRQLLANVEGRIAPWDSAYGEVEKLAGAGDPEGATRLPFRKDHPTLHEHGRRLPPTDCIATRCPGGPYKGADENYQSARWLLIILVGLGALAAAGGYSVIRSASSQLPAVAGEMLEGSRQVAAAAGQVASASQSLAQGTSEQAATLEETSSSAAEITAITRKNAENTRSVNGLMVGTTDRRRQPQPGGDDRIDEGDQRFERARSPRSSG